MAKVPQSRSTVQPADAPVLRSRVRATAETFGAGVGRTIQEAGLQIAEGLQQAENRSRQVKLLEAETQWYEFQQRQLRHPESGFLRLKKRGAFNAYKDTVDAAPAAIDRIREGLGDDPEALQQYEFLSRKWQTDYNRQVGDHIATELDVFDRDQRAASIEQLQREAEANSSNPNAVITLLERQGQIIAGREALYPSKSPEELDRDFRNTAADTWDKVINASINAENFGLAKEYLDSERVKAVLPANTRDSLLARLESREFDARAQNAAEGYFELAVDDNDFSTQRLDDIRAFIRAGQEGAMEDAIISRVERLFTERRNVNQAAVEARGKADAMRMEEVTRKDPATGRVMNPNAMRLADAIIDQNPYPDQKDALRNRRDRNLTTNIKETNENVIKTSKIARLVSDGLVDNETDLENLVDFGSDGLGISQDPITPSQMKFLTGQMAKVRTAGGVAVDPGRIQGTANTIGPWGNETWDRLLKTAGAQSVVIDAVNSEAARLNRKLTDGELAIIMREKLIKTEGGVFGGEMMVAELEALNKPLNFDEIEVPVSFRSRHEGKTDEEIGALYMADILGERAIIGRSLESRAQYVANLEAIENAIPTSYAGIKVATLGKDPDVLAVALGQEADRNLREDQEIAVDELRSLLEPFSVMQARKASYEDLPEEIAQTFNRGRYRSDSEEAMRYKNKYKTAQALRDSHIYWQLSRIRPEWTEALEVDMERQDEFSTEIEERDPTTIEPLTREGENERAFFELLERVEQMEQNR